MTSNKRQTGADSQAAEVKSSETSGSDIAADGSPVALADVAKALGAKVIVRGAKGQPLERKAGADDILGFRIHQDGKTVTATLCDGRKVEGRLS